MSSADDFDNERDSRKTRDKRFRWSIKETEIKYI